MKATGTVHSVSVEVVRHILRIRCTIHIGKSTRDYSRFLLPAQTDAILPRSVLLGESDLISSALLPTLQAIAARMVEGRTVIFEPVGGPFCSFESWTRCRLVEEKPA